MCAAAELAAAMGGIALGQTIQKEMNLSFDAALRVKAMRICELFDEGFAVSYHATFSRITELSLKEWL